MATHKRNTVYSLTQPLSDSGEEKPSTSSKLNRFVKGIGKLGKAIKEKSRDMTSKSKKKQPEQEQKYDPFAKSPEELAAEWQKKLKEPFDEEGIRQQCVDQICVKARYDLIGGLDQCRANCNDVVKTCKAFREVPTKEHMDGYFKDMREDYIADVKSGKKYLQAENFCNQRWCSKTRTTYWEKEVLSYASMTGTKWGSICSNLCEEDPSRDDMAKQKERVIGVGKKEWQRKKPNEYNNYYVPMMKEAYSISIAQLTNDEKKARFAELKRKYSGPRDQKTGALKARYVSADSADSFDSGDLESSGFVGVVPESGFGYTQDGPAIATYEYRYGESGSNSPDALMMVLLMVMVPLFLCVLCAVGNVVIGVICYLAGKQSGAKKEAVDDEPALEV